MLASSVLVRLAATLFFTATHWSVIAPKVKRWVTGALGMMGTIAGLGYRHRG